METTKGNSDFIWEIVLACESGAVSDLKYGEYKVLTDISANVRTQLRCGFQGRGGIERTWDLPTKNGCPVGYFVCTPTLIGLILLQYQRVLESSV